MTEKDYMQFIETIRSQIQKGDTKVAEKNLEYIFQIKPVRLKWFLAKAEWMFKCGYPGEEIIAFIMGKYEASLECPETEEILRLLIKIYHSMRAALEEKRTRYLLWEYQFEKNGKQKKVLPHQDFERRFQKHREDFINHPDDVVQIHLLMEDYYIRGEAVTAFILSYILEQIDSAYEEPKGFSSELKNFRYLKERFQEKENCPYILVADKEQDIGDCEVLINALLILGKKVYFLDQPLKIQIEHEVKLSDTCNISLENKEDCGDLQIYHPIEVCCNEIPPEDNRGHLVKYILGQEPENFAMLICTGSLMDELSLRETMQKNMGRLSGRAALTDNKIAFGWCGSYAAYTSRIYGFDMEERINRPAECRFSIVVPARGAADTLRYTLMTCLNQRYDMDYEVVLSDNSVNGNTAVHDLYLELEAPRLHYYKTPRDLSLTKSFEYAFLQAKGEFIFSIGADDGVLPWALSILSVILEKYPGEDILQWDRGFYAWPGFSKGQQYQFIVPGKYQRGELTSYYINREDSISMVMDNPDMMYALPLLYINSGFRRRYLKRLLDDSGELWNGPCQDIYTGVVNILLNKRILYIKYPLTIAGMSSSSIGAGVQRAVQIDGQAKGSQKIPGEIPMPEYVESSLEKGMPSVFNDAVTFYRSIHRANNRKVGMNNIPLDYKKVFQFIHRKMNILDMRYDYQILQFRIAASYHGKAFQAWCNRELCDQALIPRMIDKETIKNIENQKLYKEGISENGSETLDASKYSVSNIWEAVQLFEERTGL